jgi:hypothetical protein
VHFDFAPLIRQQQDQAFSMEAIRESVAALQHTNEFSQVQVSSSSIAVSGSAQRVTIRAARPKRQICNRHEGAESFLSGIRIFLRKNSSMCSRGLRGLRRAP